MTIARQPATVQPSGIDQGFNQVDWILFCSISLIWGSSFLLIALGLEGLTAGMVTWLRVGSGALVLVTLRLRQREKQAIRPEDRARVVALSVIWVAVPFTLFPMAQESISSALTGLLNGGTPIFVAVISVAFTRRAPAPLLIVGLALGFAGVVAMSLPSMGESPSEARGVIMVISATVCYGIAMNLASPLQQKYGSVTLMTPVLVLATLWLVPIGLRDFGENQWTPAAIAPVLLLGVVGTGTAYWIMATLVGRVGPVRASFITYLIPAVSLLLGVILLDERVAPLALVGAALTTAGAVLASRRRA